MTLPVLETDPALPVARGPVLRSVAWLLVGFAAGLAAFDRALAWIDSARDLSGGELLQRDAELAWTNRPGAISEGSAISSQGLRSPEIPKGAPPRELRILGLGASRCFGAGEGGPDMQHTWSAYLEPLCRSEFGGDWRVLNGGVIGYSAVQAARRGLRLLEPLDPDLVIVFVSPGAQMMLDPSSARHYVRVGGELLPADIAGALPEPLLPAAAALHRALTGSALYTRYRAQATDQGRRASEVDKFVLSRAPRTPEVEQTLQRTWSELDALGRACRARGCELRVLLVPEPYMDKEERWRGFLRENAALGAPPLGTPRDEPLELLRAELAQRQIASWSLRDTLAVIGADRARYTCDKAHWSAAGHELVAQALLAFLRADGLDSALPAARAKRPRE